MRGKKVTIIVDNDGKKESRIISFKEYRRMLDSGEKPRTVGIVPELPDFWRHKKEKNWDLDG